MKLAPIDCKTEDQVCSLNRSWIDSYGRWSILTDSYTVSLSDQKMGESLKQHISIPKKHFDKLVKWYLEKQETVKRGT